jgi:hypothetical protein
MMLGHRSDLTCCDRCVGSDAAELIARRRALKAAVLPAKDQSGRLNAAASAGHTPAAASDPGGAGDPGVTGHPGVLTGTVLDASPHVLTICRTDREERLTLKPGAQVWKGVQTHPTALVAGDRVVARLDTARRGVADRIWANIGRVTGVILERGDDSILVDAGNAGERQVIVIQKGAESRIQVRFPRLEPGYLIDVIGLRRGGVIEGLVPATSQPAYRANQVPRPRQLRRDTSFLLSGSATWHEPVDRPDDAEGIAYPVLDPEPGGGEQPSPGPGCERMPYLCIGSLLEIRNECTDLSRVLTVTGFGAMARLFCDRCVTCGTSPRARVADLALASFVALGGELERGCFNATIAVGR